MIVKVAPELFWVNFKSNGYKRNFRGCQGHDIRVTEQKDSPRNLIIKRKIQCQFVETGCERVGSNQNYYANHSTISNSELCLIGFFADTAMYKLCSIDEHRAPLDATHRGARCRQ